MDNTTPDTDSQVALVTAYARSMKLITLTPAEMEAQIGLPRFQRPLCLKHVGAIKRSMEAGNFISPGILFRNTFCTGKDALAKYVYLIGDSQHRVAAAIAAGADMSFIVIRVKDEVTAKDIFVNLQKGASIDPSYLIKIHPEEAPNGTIVRIQANKKHKMCGRIWLGGPELVRPDQIRAAKVKSLTRYGLVEADISSFLTFLGTCYPRQVKQNATRSGSLRGLVKFFAHHVQGIKDFQVGTSEHVEIIRGYAWPSTEDNSSNNDNAGTQIFEALQRHWLGELKVLQRQEIQRKAA